MTENGIDGEGAKEIGRALATNSSLTYLNLEGEEDMSIEYVKAGNSKP